MNSVFSRRNCPGLDAGPRWVSARTFTHPVQSRSPPLALSFFPALSTSGSEDSDQKPTIQPGAHTSVTSKLPRSGAVASGVYTHEHFFGPFSKKKKKKKILNKGRGDVRSRALPSPPVGLPQALPLFPHLPYSPVLSPSEMAPVGGEEEPLTGLGC